MFALAAAKVILNDKNRFLKINVYFQVSSLQNEVNDPHLLLHF